MKRRLLITLSLALVCAVATAVPAKRGIYRTVKLADGSEVRVELRGDEFCRYWQSDDGRTFAEDGNTGAFRQVDLKEFAAKGIMRREAVNKARAKRLPMRAPGAKKSSAFTGKKKGLIILVQFSDKKFKSGHDQAMYNDVANKENYTSSLGYRGSVRDYFKAQSYDQFDLTFDVVGPVTLPKRYSYYGQNNYNGEDKNLYEFVTSALDSVSRDVDFSIYDWDGDGEVEEVFFLYAGTGENYGTDSYTIWPHMYYISQMGEVPVYNGVKIDNYACSCEVNASGGLDGIGTICHEFSHCLGYPDLYDTSYRGNYGTGDYDLMCSGNYNGDGFCPAGYTAYERMVAGWIDPIVLHKDTAVKDMAAISDGGDAYIIYNDAHKDEYFMLENRQQKDWDAEIPGNGLTVTHIDYDKKVWDYNMVNSIYSGYNTHARCQFIPAGGSYYQDKNIPFPYGTTDKLVNSTRYAGLYNDNTDGKKYMSKPVTDIKKENGLISFYFQNDLLEPDDTADYTVPEDYLFYESFDKCTGEGGNDGSFSKSVKPDSLDFIADNSGWSEEGIVPGAACALVGNDTITGKITTPEIALDGEGTLTFRVAPYKGGSNRVIVKVAEGNAELSDTLFVTAKDKWATCRTKIAGNNPSRTSGVETAGVSGSNPVRLSFSVKSGGFYLDKVCLSTEATTGIKDTISPALRPATGRIFSIDGRYMGKDLNTLKPGVYIMDGKKKVKR